MTARLIRTAGFGGLQLAVLQIADAPCTHVRRVNNLDTLTCTIAYPADVRVRSTLRLTRDDGKQFEFRVASLVVGSDRRSAVIQAQGPWLSLARANVIRTTVSGDTKHSFLAFGTIAQILTDFFLPNLSVDGLDWIEPVLGPIENDRTLTVNIDVWTRHELIQDIVRQTQLEPYLYQPTPGGKYRIAFAVSRGSTAAPYTVAERKNLITWSTEEDDVNVVTCVTPLGATAFEDTERSTVAENAFRITPIDSEWAQLSDPLGAITVIGFDGDKTDNAIEISTSATPSYRAILATRVADQAIKLASTSGLSNAGQLVRLCEDITGAPLQHLRNPEGIRSFGKVFGVEEVDGQRGERNWIPNPAFVEGAGAWSASGGLSFIEAHDATETFDVLGLLNGAVSMGASSIALDSFPPNFKLHKHDRLLVEGTTLCVGPAGDGHTIRSDGKATLSGVTALAYAVTNNQTLTMRLGTVAVGTVTVDGNHAAGVTTLNLKGLSPTTRQFLATDKIQFEFGGTYVGQMLDPAGFSNGTGSPIAFIDNVRLVVGSFSNTMNPTPLYPENTDITAGDTVVFRGSAGDVFNAVVTADYYWGQSRLSVNLTIPPGTSAPLQTYDIEVVKTATQLRSLTNSNLEFSEAGLVTATWATGLPQSFALGRARWMDSSNTLIDYLDIVSGATNGAVNATLRFNNRAKIGTGHSFDSGSVNQVLYVGTATTLNGSGAGTVPLVSTTGTSLADNSVVRAFRNQYGWTSDVPLRNLLRVSGAAITDSFAVLLRSLNRYVQVIVTGEIFVPTSTNYFSSKGGGLANTCQCTLECNVTGLGLYTKSFNIPVPASWNGADRPAPQAFRVALDGFVLDQSRMMTVKISSSDSTQQNVWFMAKTTQLMVTADPDVPFSHASHANQLVHRGIRRLRAAHLTSSPVRGAIVELSQIPGVMRVPVDLELGQTVLIRDAATSQRAMQITCDPRWSVKQEVEFESDVARLENMVAA